jgi:hypothetical protein
VTRELRSVQTEKVLGSVTVADDGAITYRGAAEDVLSGAVRRLGAEAGQVLMADGWSNGYLYLAEATTP